MATIGTAGHVDHGKSTLVTALTGMDPDRLAEEKARGMTIDLGFAWLTLPSGREASIVDVPGHEDFIKNMLAGAGGIDVALLVVAADEGVMPQTDEHLTILDLLRVRSGVVALTKADLVDTDWLDLVRADLAERLAGTTLEHAPIVTCSAVTRAGLPDLLAALDTALDAAPARRDTARPRLPVDRVFTVAGFGTVLTGTLQDGRLRVGQEVELLPDRRRGRIRGLQTHKRTVEEGLPGSRLAVNVASVAKTEAQRGDVLALPGSVPVSFALDVALEVVPSAPHAIPHNAELEVFVGAAQTPTRLLLLEGAELAPGATGWAQLRLAHPLAALRGDRFILRQPSPSLTIAGGTVVDVQARRHKRHDTALLARLAALAHGDPADLVLTALRPAATTSSARRPGGYGGRDLPALVRATGLSEDDVTAALAELEARGALARAGDFVYDAEQWQRLRMDALAALAAHHRQYPLRPGMPREDWRARLGLSPREAAAVLAALAAEGEVVEASAEGAGRGALVRLAGHQPQFTAEQERAVERTLARFQSAPFAPPMRAEVERELGPELVAALIDRGTLLRAGASLLLEPSAYAEAVRRVAVHLHAHGRLTVAEARDLLDTSRKYMLPILELLDEQRITRRLGDDRVAGINAPSAAQASAPVAAPPPTMKGDDGPDPDG
ncbi:MAG TPA: selenocysteine-specific translation elongation factor [Ktedonobacterales bacterium]